MPITWIAQGRADSLSCEGLQHGRQVGPLRLAKGAMQLSEQVAEVKGGKVAAKHFLERGNASGAPPVPQAVGTGILEGRLGVFVFQPRRH